MTNIHFPPFPSRTPTWSSASPVHLYLFPDCQTNTLCPEPCGHSDCWQAEQGMLPPSPKAHYSTCQNSDFNENHWHFTAMRPQLRQSCQLCLERANKYRSYQEALDERDRRKKKKCECKNFSLKIRQQKEQRSLSTTQLWPWLRICYELLQLCHWPSLFFQIKKWTLIL